jgi:hypothetical protein
VAACFFNKRFVRFVMAVLDIQNRWLSQGVLNSAAALNVRRKFSGLLDRTC